MSDACFTIRICRGGLHMSHEVYDSHLSGVGGIVLLRRDSDLLILPVRHAASGGYLLKCRNSAGDRVAHAPDFFRAHGIADEEGRDLSVAWDAAQGGFVAKGVLPAY